MDPTKQSFQLSQEKSMFLRSIPTLVGFGWTVYMPYAAHKSLKIWRALQVYDSQGLFDKELVMGKPQQKKTLKTFSIYLFLLVTVLILLIDKEAWPVYSNIRQSLPSIYIGIIAFFVFKNLVNSFLSPPIEKVARKRQESKEGGFKVEFIPSIVAIGQTSHLSTFLSLVFSSILVFYCAASSNSIMILAIITPIISLLSIQGSDLPQDKISLRLFTKDSAPVFVILGMFLAFFQGLIYLIAYSISSSDKDNLKGEIIYNHNHIILLQFKTVVDIVIWPLSMYPSAVLLGLAYRFDAHQAGYTKVTAQMASLAISESKTSIKANGQSNSSQDLDQVPILLEANALQLPFLLNENRKAYYKLFPTFNIAFKTTIAIHLIGLLLTCVLAKSWFAIPYFVKTLEEIPAFLFTFPFNFVSLFSFFALPPVMLIDIAIRERKNGVDFKTAMNKLWNHEETWLADYNRTSFYHEY